MCIRDRDIIDSQESNTTTIINNQDENTEKVVNGYDNSGLTSSNDTLKDSLSKMEEQEGQAMEQDVYKRQLRALTAC